MNIQRIVVIGPESTGKSTLCAQLADHFGTTWVREYAREYLLTNGKAYTPSDLLRIAQGQLQLENAALAALAFETEPNPYRLFIDTDMLVMKIWSEYVFGDCHEFILRAAANQQRDLYLLCAPDLPWTADELREYPDEGPREALFHHYRDTLINQSTPWALVQGTEEERFVCALNAIHQQL